MKHQVAYTWNGKLYTLSFNNFESAMAHMANLPENCKVTYVRRKKAS